MSGSRWSEPGDAGQVRPSTNAHFLVDLGTGDPGSPAAGFFEVVFPPFQAGLAAGSLILRRGVTASRDLVEWWSEARVTKPPDACRTVTVTLLADDRTTVVRTWRFGQARPVTLSYSPLNALQGTVLIETIELAFDTIEIG